MGSFRDIPIRRKLMVIVMLTTTLALALSGIGIVLADSLLFRGYLQRDLATLAQIVGENSTAALAFDESRSAGETLAALRARSHLVAACIFRNDGTILATYARQGAARQCPPVLALDGIRSSSSALTVSHSIRLENRRIGTLTMLYDFGEVYERRKLYGATVLGVLLASSVIAYLLSSSLRAVIANPISQLAQATRSVSETRDYSIRARKLSGDEIGVLVDAFNEMLSRIQSRDNEFMKALLDREEALSETRNARDFLKTTLASIGDAVISTDVEGRVVFANRVAQSLLGVPEAEMTGRHLNEVFQVVNEFSRARVDSPVTTVLHEGLSMGRSNQSVLMTRDGKELPIEESGAPIRGDSGTIQGTVLVFRDVTARRRAEETRALLAAIVESSEDAIIGHDLDAMVTSWNNGAERIFGYSADEVIGRPASIIAAPGFEDDLKATLERIGRGERVQMYHAIRRTKRGNLINVSIAVSPLYDSLGRIVGASKIARDMTEQARAAEQLEQLNADLLRSNRSLARSNEDLERFAFVASHDLQEPLRMIAIYSQLLVKAYPGEVDKQTGAFVSNIVDGTRRMRELISDLLAYTEIGALPEEATKPLDLNAVIGKVTQNLKAAIEETGALITVDSLPTVNVHEGHFIPLFQNLIGNAIKYRGERQPRIHVSVVEVDGQFRFAVTDNGMGIEPEYHQKIFGAFKRLHGKKIPGTGIGLAICQRVVERYGGRIWVDSKAGEGSAFFFTLSNAGNSVEESSDGRT